MFNSSIYWQGRYIRGMGSGAGSDGKLAEFKADVVNDIIKRYGIKSMLDFGCGDGVQLGKFEVDRYLGIDVSDEAIDICKWMYAGDFSKKFAVYSQPFIYKVDLAISMDMIFHLVKDDIYKLYMHDLFSCSDYVLVYSSNTNKQVKNQGIHMKQRKFTKDVPKGWKLIETIKNKYPYDKDTGTGSLCDFYLFKKS